MATLPKKTPVKAPALPRQLLVLTQAPAAGETTLEAVQLNEVELADGTTCDWRVEDALLRKVTGLRVLLRKSSFVNCKMDLCNFTGAEWMQPRLRRVEIANCRLDAVTWFEADCRDVLFRQCRITHASLMYGRFQSVRFEDCDLSGTRFDESGLGGVTFERCNLSGASFNGADLTGTDLRSSKLDGLLAGPRDLMGAVIAPEQASQVVHVLGVTVKAVGEEL